MSGQTLHNRRALVTGASQGIGRAIAQALRAQGADVYAAGRNLDTLAGLKDDCQAQPVLLDLAADESIAALAAVLAPGIDILVNCGGMYRTGTMRDSEPGMLEEILRVNVVGPAELTRQLLPGLIDRQGQVVFVNSSIVRGGGPATGHFAACNHALRAIADSLRAEVNPLGMRVLSVFPGRTATPRQAGIFAKEGRDYRPASLLQPQDVAASIVHALSLPPTAELTEMYMRPAQNFS